MDWGDKPRAPEKRKALIQHIAKHATVPEEYQGRCYNPDDPGITAEEQLLIRYVSVRERWSAYFSADYWNSEAGKHERRTNRVWLRCMPWEQVRLDRASRLALISALVESGGLEDDRAKAINDFCKRRLCGPGIFDSYIWNSLDGVVKLAPEGQNIYNPRRKPGE